MAEYRIIFLVKNDCCKSQHYCKLRQCKRVRSPRRRRANFIQGVLNDSQYSRIWFSTSEREINSNGQLGMCPEVRCFLPIIIFRYPLFAWSCMIPTSISNKYKMILSSYVKNTGHKTTFMEHLHKLIYWENPLTRLPRFRQEFTKKTTHGQH